jgi:hypothetical protein
LASSTTSTVAPIEQSSLPNDRLSDARPLHGTNVAAYWQARLPDDRQARSKVMLASSPSASSPAAADWPPRRGHAGAPHLRIRALVGGPARGEPCLRRHPIAESAGIVAAHLCARASLGAGPVPLREIAAALAPRPTHRRSTNRNASHLEPRVRAQSAHLGTRGRLCACTSETGPSRRPRR